MCAPPTDTRALHRKHPAGNRFTDEERASFASNYIDNGFIDAFRHQYPDVVGYTYWSRRFKNLREQNKGWRLDYYLVRCEGCVCRG